MFRLTLLFLVTVALASCGKDAPKGDATGDAAPQRAPETSGDKKPGVEMPGNRRLLPRGEVENRLGLTFPKAWVLRDTLQAGYTFAVWLDTEDKLDDVVTWFRQNVDSQVPARYEELPPHRTDRWATRKLGGKTIRMAQYDYQEGGLRMQVDVTEYDRKPLREVHIDLISPSKEKIPPAPR